jgi:hypothetical protein
MIVYLCTANNSQGMATWLGSWGSALAGRMAIMYYEALTQYRTLPQGAYIFSDLELLSDGQTRLAESLWDQLAAAGDKVRLLNHPARALRRYDLIKALRSRQMLPYDVYRATELPADIRFPAFVRVGNDHEGSRTPLLHQRQNVELAIISTVLRGHQPHQVMVGEFCDVSRGSGIYHKYGAFRVGDKIIPRHLLYSRNWVVKPNDRIITTDTLARERDYLESNPHEKQLREIFDLAQIQYGRIDYSIVDEKIIFWEIDMPSPGGALDRYPPALHPSQHWFVRQIMAAFQAIDLPTSQDPAAQIPIQLDLSRVVPH